MKTVLTGTWLLAAAATLSSLAAAAPAADPAPSRAPAQIFVAGYDGLVRTVELTDDGKSSKLNQLSQSDGCKANPSWLLTDMIQKRLWCVDEAFATNIGTLNQFDIGDKGVLTPKQSKNISAGPVYTSFFNGGKSIAIAHFGGPDASGLRGGVLTYALADSGTILGAANMTLNPQAKGPQQFQALPRVHAVFPDPKNKYLVALDYGGDKVRTYKIKANGTLSEGPVAVLPPGTGPRHGVFYSHTATSQLYLLVVSEFANTITTFNVSYGTNDTMSLTGPSRVIDTFGGAAKPEVLAKAKAAEIRVSPDNQFVVVSNRNDTSFANSDSLATYRVNADGSLAFVQLAAAGGLFPRSFHINNAGDRVVVAAQSSSAVVVLARDPQTGFINEVLTSLTINTGGAGVPAAIWYE